MKNPPFADGTLLGTWMQIAYGMTLGFTRTAPSIPARHVREAPAVPAPKRRNVLLRALDAMDKWFYRQQLAARERYLAQAQDIFELEARMRELERRRPYY